MLRGSSSLADVILLEGRERERKSTDSVKEGTGKIEKEGEEVESTTKEERFRFSLKKKKKLDLSYVFFR